MALSRVKTWVSGEILYAADLNAEFNNLLNNPISLVSPWTSSMAAGGFDLTGMDELAFNDASADATAAGRLRRNSAALTWHDGTAARNLVWSPSSANLMAGLVFHAKNDTEASSTTSGGVDLVTVTTNLATTDAFLVTGQYRRDEAAGGAANVQVRLKLNTTLVGDTLTSLDTDGANSGAFVWVVLPREANYLGGLTGLFSLFGEVAPTTPASLLMPIGEEIIPNATITSVIINAKWSNGAVTVSVKNVRVYKFLSS